MSIKDLFTGIFEKRNVMDGLITQGRSLYSLDTAAGVSVTPEKSLQVTAVFACVRVLSESVASLPLHLYQRDSNGGKSRAANHPLYKVLHNLANPEMTSFQLREVLVGHLCLWGDAYCEIEYDANGNVIALWPLRPDQMDVRRENGELVYKYGGKAIPSYRIFHVPGFSINGVNGLSMIKQAKQAIGLSLVTEEFGSRFFANGARPGTVLEYPGQLSDEAYTRLKNNWEDRHMGSSNSHRVAILEEGMTVQEVGIPPEDAQFLETRKFQINEIARIFRVPPHMIGDLDRATFSNIEQQSIDFVTNSLRPWLVRIEQAIYKDLLTDTEQKKYFPEFLVDGLLRGDTVSRYQAYAVARQNGWMSANDVRECENMNPIDGGDVYLIPLNMVPADQVGSDQFRKKDTQYEARAAVENRAKQSLENRRRLMISYRRVIGDTTARIYRREANDLVRGAKKSFKTRSYSDFQAWLDTFYTEHEDFIVRQMLPTMQSYAEVIAAEAAKEVKFDDLDQDHLDRFIRRYVMAFASRQVEESRKKIEKCVADAQAEGTDPADAVEKKVADWDTTRAASVAQDESVRANGAVSSMVYTAAGIMFLVWHSYGDSCPYCKSLDGRKVGIDQWFLEENKDFKPDGADSPLTPNRNIKHPPAHGGCDCMIGAGL